MTETPSVTAISEQGGKEKTRYDNDKRHCSAGGIGSGRRVQTRLSALVFWKSSICVEEGGSGTERAFQGLGVGGRFYAKPEKILETETAAPDFDVELMNHLFG
jgi:hypothetical protein